MYVYRFREGLDTPDQAAVGYINPSSGYFHVDSEFIGPGAREQAAARVSYLNGGNDPALISLIMEHLGIT